MESKEWRKCNLMMGLTVMDDDDEDIMRRIDQMNGETPVQVGDMPKIEAPPTPAGEAKNE